METDVGRPSLVPVGARLNHTMQYGNSNNKMENKMSVEFKSYYVVWKHVQSKSVSDRF